MQDRWHKQDEWKKSAYAFVPYQTHFGELCGFADDVVNTGRASACIRIRIWSTSTIVVSGSQSHKDDTGSEGIVNENTVQTMSAGTGIMHSEYNTSSTKPLCSYRYGYTPKSKM
jgi:redox-sensitive bicupin YhaK (pirin superfamily)